MAYKDKRCAPAKVYEEGSCIPTDVLIKITNAYNKSVEPGLQIKLDNSKDTLNPNGYKKYLIKELTEKLSGVCKDQICWTKQNFIKYMDDDLKNDLKHNTFRPVGPTGRTTWLSTVDINKVMKQYETKYPDFKFLGAVPIDFDNIDVGIKDLNFNELKKIGKTKIGIIFNLDEHYKSGSHWVAAYADLNKGEIRYSDSYGYRPQKEIRHFLKRVANYCQTAGLRPDVDYNKIRHQREGSECGVYSINFILRLLRGDSYQNISKNVVPDKKINKCRTVYFNNTDF